MSHCININHKEILQLSEELNLPKIVIASKCSIWQTTNNNFNRFPTASELYSGEDLKYTLKAIDLVSKNLKKIQGLWNQIKNKEVFWNKIQKDFGIPKEQIEILKESEGDKFDDKFTNFVANYSYVVQIKTAKQKYSYNASDPEYRRDGSTINNGDPTQHYSNLAVPGGTNYTENEISTPAITPSIKGHAQFSTDNGIGWFRSDEKANKGKWIVTPYRRGYYQVQEGATTDPADIDDYIEDFEDGKITEQDFLNKTGLSKEPKKFESEFIWSNKKIGSKTRRILEVQSDLFQKGRDKKDLTKTEDVSFYQGVDENYNSDFLNQGEEMGLEPMPSKEEIEKRKNKTTLIKGKDISKENNFLQLLNKDNNWVNFFIKSIIQNSNKKGYEKVLFPKGDTASKIEGHTTLEEFKKEKEYRLGIIEKELSLLKQGELFEYKYGNGNSRTLLKLKDGTFYDASINKDGYPIGLFFNRKEELSNIISNKEREIKQYKEEIERVNSEGLAALKPIYNFYENIVGNILKKQFKDSIKEITDEYNNSWYELDLSSPEVNKSTNTVLFQLPKESLEDKLKNSGFITQTHGDLFIKKQFYKDAINLIGVINKENPGSITVSKAESTTHRGGAFIWKVTINSQLNLRNDLAAQLSTKATERNEKLENSLKTFLNNNGISLEILNSLKERLGVDAVGAYDSLRKMVLIAEGKAKRDTLPEETGHVITDLLGKDHTLIKSLYSLIDKYKIDYAEDLGIDYVLSYGGDSNKLKEEFIGKLIGRVMIEKFEDMESKLPKSFLQKAKILIQKILDRFFGIFKKDFSKVEEQYKELYPIVSQLAEMGLSGNRILSTSQPFGELLFQLPDKDSKIKEKVDDEIKRGLAYLGRKNSQMKNKVRVLNKEGKDELADAEEAKRLKYITIRQELKSTGNKQTLIDLGLYELEKVRNFIDNLDSGKLQINKFTDSDISFTLDIIKQFGEIEGLKDESSKLENRLLPYLKLAALGYADKWTTRQSGIKMQDILDQSTDIDSLSLNYRALHDSSDILGQTAGSIIKAAQNTYETLNTKAANRINEEVDKFIKYQKSKGTKDENLYDIFNQEFKNKTVFTMEGKTEFYEKYWSSLDTLKKGSPKEILTAKKWLKEHTIYGEKGRPKLESDVNPNWKTIQKSPELLRFYNFFKKEISDVSDQLPVDINTNFIPNLMDKSIKDLIKTGAGKFFKETTQSLLKVRSEDVNPEIYDEELLNEDYIPLKYLNNIAPGEKSKNLGEALLKFVEFGNQYEQMSEALPKLRLIQEVIKNKAYVHHNETSLAINGKESNIFKLINGYIDMQIKGKKKIDEGKWINWKTTDEEGNEINKHIYMSDLVDQMLKYNSLLRIGFNPVGALKNVLYGRTSNWIEALGGRYFTRKELRASDAEFTKNFRNHDSKFWKMIELLNPLQELQDYDRGSKLRLKSSKDKLEKLKEIGYSLQKGGEFYLQTTPMIASMIHDKVETKDGNKISLWDAFELNKEGELKLKNNIDLTLDDVLINKITNKIQGLNQLIHGRYSERDASLASQHVVYRTISQFRKFIPTAIEARMVKKYFNNRLGVEVEGRYRIFGRVILGIFQKDKLGFVKMLGELYKTRKDLTSGKNFTELELYNMRKNLIEVVLLTATIATAAMLLGGNDPNSKRRRKNPGVRFVLDQLNSVSGDLTYFYSPTQMNKLVTNVAPLAKTVSDIIMTVENVSYAFGGKNSEYRRGARKGESKFYGHLKDLIPLYNPTEKVIRYFNGEDYNVATGANLH